MNTKAQLAIALGRDCNLPQYSFDGVNAHGDKVVSMKPAFRALNMSVMSLIADAPSTKGEQVDKAHHSPEGQLAMRSATNLQGQILAGATSANMEARDCYRGLAIIDAALHVVFMSKATNVEEALDYLDPEVVTAENAKVLEELSLNSLAQVVEVGVAAKAAREQALLAHKM